MHLPLKAGTDIHLFNALFNYIDRKGAIDWEFVINCTKGMHAALDVARTVEDPVSDSAQCCDLEIADVKQFFDWFVQTEKTVTVYSQGVNQWSWGTDKVNAIINCHLATGRIGKPGMGPFSFTGQPNAMGGREVGGLANQLAAHMDFTSEHLDTVRRFWNAPRLAEAPGLKAVDLFEAIEAGKVKAVWIMATNPAVSLPDADRFRRALQQCDLVVVSDCVDNTDTAQCADVLLPATTWGEKDGTVTNSERCISRQIGFLDPPGEAMHDWWILTQVAARMGFTDSFRYETVADIFREHAALSAYENDGSRDFNLSGLQTIDNAGYDLLRPVQWPVYESSGSDRMFTDRRFYHSDGRARFVAVTAQMIKDRGQKYPFALNTGRVRDQWHTMTRTGNSPILNRHIAEPYVAIHPKDAIQCGLEEGGLAKLSSDYGEMLARVSITEDQRSGSLFVPIHWNDSNSKQCRVGALINPSLDPVSGQPQFKYTPVSIAAYKPAWQGFLLSREKCELPESSYAVAVKEAGFWRYELAGDQDIDDPERFARILLGETGEWLDFNDSFAGHYRGARIDSSRLSGCLFLTHGGNLPSHEWLGRLFANETMQQEDRRNLLAGKPLSGLVDQGKIVCACFNVGINTLIDAIKDQKLTTIEQIGEALKAGTNCGSCIPEIRKLL